MPGSPHGLHWSTSGLTTWGGENLDACLIGQEQLLQARPGSRLQAAPLLVEQGAAASQSLQYQTQRLVEAVSVFR